MSQSSWRWGRVGSWRRVHDPAVPPRRRAGGADGGGPGDLRRHHVRALLPLAISPAQFRPAKLRSARHRGAFPGGGRHTAGFERARCRPEPFRRARRERALRRTATPARRRLPRWAFPGPGGRPGRAGGTCSAGDLRRAPQPTGQRPQQHPLAGPGLGARSDGRGAGRWPSQDAPLGLKERDDRLAGLHRSSPEQRGPRRRRPADQRCHRFARPAGADRVVGGLRAPIGPFSRGRTGFAPRPLTSRAHGRHRQGDRRR